MHHLDPDWRRGIRARLLRSLNGALVGKKFGRLGMENEADIPLDPRTDNCVAISRRGHDVNNILTVQ